MTVLVAVLMVLGTAIGSFYLYRKHKVRAQLAEWRNHGMQAYHSGDYPVAIAELANYLTRHTEDVEALSAYVDARPKVEAPQFQHLTETLRALRYLVQLEPDRLEHRCKLLDLYQRLGLRTETLETAEHILRCDPHNVRALELRTRALIDLKRYSDALVAAGIWVDADPLSLSASVNRISVRILLGQQITEIFGELDEWAKAHPVESARYELLKGIAYAAEGDKKQSLVWLRKAADRQPPDGTFSRLLVEQFVTAGDAGEELVVLRSQAAKSGSREVTQMLLCRLWEQGLWEEACGLVNGIDLTEAETPTDILAVACLAAQGTGRTPDASRAYELLCKRRSTVAMAWRLICGTSQTALTTPAQAHEVAGRCRAALTEEPGNLYLSYYLGEALCCLGEDEQAIEAWEAVANAKRAWGRPLARMAEVLLERGQLSRAAEPAAMAFQRGPNVASALVVARVAVALVEQGNDTGNLRSHAFMQLMGEVERLIPGAEEVELLRIQFMAQSGKREEAIHAMREQLQRQPPASESLLLRLAAISGSQGYGLDGEVLALDAKCHGMTPSLALALALKESAAGRAGEALKSLQSARAQNSNGDNAAQWGLAEARLLDLAGDDVPAAVKAWREVSDGFPDNFAVQRAALEARAVQSDRMLFERVLGRLRRFLGEQSLVCDLAHVRMLIATRRTDADDREIAAILNRVVAAHPNLAEPRALWSESLRLTGKLDAAIDQLQLAVSAEPDSAPLALHLAGLYHVKGDSERATQLLDRVVAAGGRASEQIRIAARLLAEQGEYTKATAAMERLPEHDGGRVDDLLLAGLYWRRNQPEKVTALLDRMMAHPSAEAIEFAARFYGVSGKREEALRALKQLDALKLAPGQSHLILGNFHSAMGEVEAAIMEYRAGVLAAPSDIAAHRALVTYLYLAGRPGDAVTANEQALAAIGDSWCGHVQRASGVIGDVCHIPEMRGVLLDYLRDPGNQRVSLDVLETVARATHADSIAATAFAQTLSQRYPHVEGVQLWAGRIYLAAHRNADAWTLLSRAMIAFPDSASVAAAATRCSASRGQWSEMLLAARTWRARTAADSDRVSADIATARALLRLDRPGEAIALLRPGLPGKASASPVSRLTLEGIACYAEALCSTGEVGQAAQLLLSAAREEPLFRAAAIRLAAEQLDEKNGRQWLEQLETFSDAQSMDQVATLGRAWAALAARHAGNAECLERARRCFDVVRASGDKSAFALEEAAIFSERMGDSTAAIDLYRRALSVDPRRLVSLNELACLLAANGEQLADAKKFADAAVAIAPEEPEFLDTLASVHVKSHDYAAAQQLLRRAAQLDPENPRWRIVLAQLLLDDGKRDEAAKTVDAIDASGTDLSKLPEPLRKQLIQLRMLTSPASNSRDGGPAAAAK